VPALAGNLLAGLTPEGAERVRHERKTLEAISGSLFVDYFRIAADSASDGSLSLNSPTSSVPKIADAPE